MANGISMPRVITSSLILGLTAESLILRLNNELRELSPRIKGSAIIALLALIPSSLAKPKLDLSKIPTGLINAIYKELLKPHAICFNNSTYELYDSFIYDIGVDIYMCNNRIVSLSSNP